MLCCAVLCCAVPCCVVLCCVVLCCTVCGATVTNLLIQLNVFTTQLTQMVSRFLCHGFEEQVHSRQTSITNGMSLKIKTVQCRWNYAAQQQTDSLFSLTLSGKKLVSRQKSSKIQTKLKPAPTFFSLLSPKTSKVWFSYSLTCTLANGAVFYFDCPVARRNF